MSCSKRPDTWQAATFAFGATFLDKLEAKLSENFTDIMNLQIFDDLLMKECTIYIKYGPHPDNKEGDTTEIYTRNISNN